jgi:predicted short-subunit dehydrogenase-like oxidoreductase (DUF2520 family)
MILRCSFIGAGKVGTSFGVYLKNNGFLIHGYYSRNYIDSLQSAKLTKSKAESDIGLLVDNSDIIFITTRDDEIINVCIKIIEEKIICNNKIFVHMSGGLTSQILELLKKQGSFVFSLHPMQAFADIDKSVSDLKNTFFSIEGSEEKIQILEDMLFKMGNKYIKLEKDQKILYHAGACVISNYMVSLIDYGLSLFETVGLNRENCFESIYPLVKGNIENIRELGITKALTGPIVRGDIETVKSHIKALEESNNNVKSYKDLGLMTINLIEREKMLNNNIIKELKNIFNKEQ